MNLKLKATAILIFLLLHVSLANASDKSQTDAIVDASLVTLDNFVRDPTMVSFQNRMKSAKGFLIIPKFYKGGFLLGGSGGTGVLLRKNQRAQNNTESLIEPWSFPAFYSMGSVTLGLQIGGEVAEVILLFMNNRGLDAMLSKKLQAGVDASIAAGPVGTGTQIATSDIIMYSRGKGAFGGLTMEGALITSRDSLNSIYYGVDASPLEILITGQVDNFQSNPLRAKLAEISGDKVPEIKPLDTVETVPYPAE